MFKKMWTVSSVLVFIVCGSSFAENIVDGGNSTGADIIIGTNDNYRLNLETNNTPRITIDTSGNVGIGTTAPSTKVDVNGAISGWDIAPIGSVMTWLANFPNTPALPDG